MKITPLPVRGPRGIVQFDDFAVWQHFVAEDESVALEVKVDERGGPRCVALTARDDDGVTGEAMRSLPVARLLKAAFVDASFKLDERGVGHLLSTPLKDREAFYGRVAKDARQPRQGSPITEDDLRQVAELYRAALGRGDPPTQTVANSLQVARSTAARWVARARERNLLGPALRGRAGEEEKKK